MKTKNNHRWLALFMVFAMLIGTLPVTAFAEGHTHSEDCYAQGGELICTADKADTLLPVATYAEEKSEAAIGETNYGTLQEAVNNAQNGDTIRVLRDISLTKDTLVTIAPDTPKEITIDLNQKTISYPNDDEWDTTALTISKPITLNIKNGKIDVGDEDHTAIQITCAEKTPVDLTLSGVTIQAGNAAIDSDIDNAAGKNRIMLENVDITSDEYGVHVSDADITFKSGSIHTTNDETFSLSRCSLTIDDGEFITTDDTCMNLWDEDTVVINGGHFKSGDDNALYLSWDSKATINGGIFEAPDKAICTGDEEGKNVTLGENLKTVLPDGTTLEDFLNSTYVSVVKTTATVTFISDGQKVAEVLVRKGQNISDDDLTDQSMPADPTKDNYIFKGWWTGENGTGEAFTGTSIVTNDLTVYAKMDEVSGSLTVSKVVAGNAGSQTTDFNFTVKLSDTSVSGTHGDMTFVNGVAKFTLKHNEKKIAIGLPAGITYEVAESEANQNGYATTSANASGSIIKDQNVTVAFTNTKNSGGGHASKTYYYFAIEKIDAQDSHTLSGAKFGLYLDGNRVATATSNRSGIALFRIDKNDYRKITVGRELYYQELTAPEGYILNSDKIGIEKSDLTTSQTSAEKKAETVRNYQKNAPADLNGNDHVAYVHGYTDGTVKPCSNVTRAETAAMLYRLLTENRRNEIQTASNSFSDVSADAWYNEPVSTMANGKYIMGFPDGTFGGNKNITRAELVAMLVRFIEVQNEDCSFTDVSRDYWAYGCIATATKAGWIAGYPDGTFKPEQPITRAEAMTIINRVLNRGVNEKSELMNFKVWPDNEPSAWYYYEVIEASNEHEYTGSRPSENWTSLHIH